MDSAMVGSLIPLMIVGAATIIIMLLVAVRRMYGLTWAITVIGLGAALIADLIVPASNAGAPLFRFDAAAQYFSALLLLVNLIVALLSHRFIGEYRENREEFYLLLLLETTGSVMLVASSHFISFIIGLELLSVPLYAMLGYVRNSDLSLEAATKYFILTAVASAIVVFGLGLIYFQTGSLTLSSITDRIAASGLDPLLVTGLGLVFAGLAFKLAVFPFHMWAADVYEGSPLPATAVISTASKVAVFAFLYRMFQPVLSHNTGGLAVAIVVFAAGSMVVGNFLALKQTNIKRLLAYSSTANLGYLLIPLVSGTADSPQAAFFYLSVYAFTNLGILGVMTMRSSPDAESTESSSYAGLLYRRPLLALVFILMLLSLAGLPISAGFFAKLYLFKTSIQGAQWFLSAVFVLASATGLYYYLRLVFVQTMHAKAGVGDGPEPAKEQKVRNPATVAAMLVAAAIILVLGLYPSLLLSLLQSV
ncbi:MAG TPA: NADH-quinone oxidoreductase subunit N [Spirochaetia bacterium]|nr:NADH-quinone oxidoreductase subunit N [Spirochaetia bacterium]